MFDFWKGLCRYIYPHLRGGREFKVHALVCNVIPQEMVMDVNMFGPVIESWILCPEERYMIDCCNTMYWVGGEKNEVPE